MKKSLQAKVRRLEKKGVYVPEQVKKDIKEARYPTLASLRRDKFSKLGRLIETYANEEIEEKRYSVGGNQSDMILSNVNETINDYPSSGAEILREALDSEIEKYGDKVIANAMASADEDLVHYAREIVYYKGSKNDKHRAIKDFFEIIKSERLKNGDVEQIGNAMDRMTDMGDEE